MIKNKIHPSAVVLVIAFVLSLSIVWDIMTVFFGECRYYWLFHFMCSAYYLQLSIMLTQDIEIFRKSFMSNGVVKKSVDIVLHICAAALCLIIYIALSIPAIFSIGGSGKEIQQNKKSMREQIQAWDSKPLEVRSILPAATITILLIAPVSFDLIPATWKSWIQSILDFGIAMVSFYFVWVNYIQYKQQQAKVSPEQDC